MTKRSSNLSSPRTRSLSAIWSQAEIIRRQAMHRTKSRLSFLFRG
jgi:hypothetical protein